MLSSGCRSLFVSLLLCTINPIKGITSDRLGETVPCDCDKDGQPCTVDGYVGSDVLYEDDTVRIWNFTLSPGEMTSMHKHDHDYHFVAIHPTQLEVWGENGTRLFDFRAEGVLGFRVRGDFLEPIGIELPFPVPRVHAAKNIGDYDYYEILYESKTQPSADAAAGAGADVVAEL